MTPVGVAPPTDSAKAPESGTHALDSHKTPITKEETRSMAPKDVGRCAVQGVPEVASDFMMNLARRMIFGSGLAVAVRWRCEEEHAGTCG